MGWVVHGCAVSSACRELRGAEACIAAAICGFRELPQMPRGCLRDLEEDPHGECSARSERSSRGGACRFLADKCAGDVLLEGYRVRLWEPVEATLLHKDW